jgi:serine/threonine protein kinase
MDRNAALAHLGLRGNEDSAGVLQLANARLASARQRLRSARSHAERIERQHELALLVEAFDHVTAVIRSAGYPGSRASSPSTNTVGRVPVQHVEPGTLLGGRIEVGELLGSGGMGTVYAAHDRLKQEDIAIKVLRQDLLLKESAGKRFFAEAKLSCSLSHPNIVRVHDIGVSGNQYYFSMERLRGRTLRQRMIEYRHENRLFSIAEVTDIARQLIDALRYAHRFLVHQDIKPENIWVANDGVIKLMDFGIARTYSEFRSTRYVAPEHQPVRDRVDWRVDQFSLAIVLYELLTGALPVGELAPLHKLRRDVSSRYAKAITRAMSLTPDDRWASLDDMLIELEAPVDKSRLAAAAVLTGALLFAAGAGAVAYYGRLPPLLSSESNAAAKAAPVLFSSSKTNDTPTAAESTSASTAKLPSVPSRDAAMSSITADVSGYDRSQSTQDMQMTKLPASLSDVTATHPSRAQLPGSITRKELQSAATAATAASPQAQCVNQCERDQGECRSITRRGRQQCLSAAAFNSNGRGTSSLTDRGLAECAFYDRDRCEYARDSRSCLRRIHLRHEECAAAYGNVAQHSQDCGVTANDAERRCLTELRDCRASCR